jgi:hypothetical protein
MIIIESESINYNSGRLTCINQYPLIVNSFKKDNND